MPHHRTGRHSLPPFVAGGVQESRHVDRIGGEHQLAPEALPRTARTVGIDLDAEVVGILQVERFADQVIARPRARADLSQVPHEAP